MTFQRCCRLIERSIMKDPPFPGRSHPSPRGRIPKQYFNVDLVVNADAAAIVRVRTDAMTFAQAVRAGGLRLDGPRDPVRASLWWLLLSHSAHVEWPARAG